MYFARFFLLLPLLLTWPSLAQAQNQLFLDKTTYTVSESAGTANIVVRLTRADSNQVSVSYTTADGTAVAGSDYTATSGILTFGPNDTAKLVQIPIIDDLTAESNEQFSFTISAAQGAIIDGARSTATVTIQDNDNSGTVISFDSSSYSVAENGGSVQLRITRTGTASGNVNYTTIPGSATEGDSAIPGVDYRRTSGTVTFPNTSPDPNEDANTQIITIPIFDDSDVEGDETFMVNLSAPGTDFSFAQSTATVTIIDNETSSVNFSASAYSVTEGAGNATITLLRTGNTNTAARVVVNTVGGTATADKDYASLTQRNVDFAQGQTFATFDVPIFQDQEVEGTESFYVSLSASPNSGVVVPGGTSTAEVRIIDDETANTVEFAGRDFSVNENAGSAQVTLRLNRVGDTSQVVTVQYFTETGSATPNQDYTPVTPASNSRVTFGPGETIKTFSIPIVNDSTPENTETIGLTLANPTNASLGSNSTATLAILDDDSAGTVQFSTSFYSVSESSGFVTLTVLLNRTGNTSAPVSVNYTTVPGSAAQDRFVQTSGTLNFASGSSVATITVPVNNDTIIEPAQTFSVQLSNPINASLGNPSFATVTMQDDDGLNTVEFDAADYGAVEKDGVVQVRVRATRGGDPNQILTVQLTLGGPGDTATNPDDYQAPASTSITFPAGVSVQVIAIPITNNLNPQASRFFTIGLTNPGLFTQIGRQSSARVTIFDNSGPNTVQLLTSVNRFREGDQQAISITVVRFGAFDRNGTHVNFTTEVRPGDTAQSGVNFTQTSGTIEFAAQVQSQNGQNVVVGNETLKSIIIPIPNNTLVQGDVTFHVTLTSSDVAQLGSISSTQVTITDDDLGNTLQFSSSTYSVSEANGFATLTVNLIPNGDASKATSVDFSATPITAFAGFDFSPVNGTLTFAPGETSKTIQIPINNDTISEPTETFRVTLSNPGPGSLVGTPSTAIVSIIDDDASSSIQFSPSNYTVSETGGSVTLTVIASRQGNPNNVLSVNYQTFAGTATENADYTGASGVLTFSAGQTQKTITVQILNDNLIESTESFSIVLSNPSDGASVGTASAATVDIADDDSPNATIGFSASGYSVDEGAGFANLTVQRSGGLGISATVNFATANGTAVAGVNYTATSGTVTFAPGEVSRIIQVPILDDPNADPTLTFTVTLTSPSGTGFVGGQSTATVSIIDNDFTTFRFNPLTYTVDEGAGNVVVTVEAARSGDQSTILTVDYFTGDGTAAAGVRYQRSSGTLTFPAGVTKQTISIPLIDDSIGEGTQDFFITLTNPQASGGSSSNGPRVIGGSANVTVIDNDASTFQFSSPSYLATNPSGVATLTVTLSRLTNANGVFTVDYSTSDISAQAGVDYTPTSGTLAFAPGETSKSISVTLTPEPAGQPSRQFRVTLSNPTSGAVLGQTSTAVVTITNFDLSTKLMNVSTRAPVEQGNGVMIAGVIVQDTAGKQLIIRALGPSLTARGVLNAIQDPTLQLMDANGAQMAFNDDFAANTSTDQTVLHGTGLTPEDSREAALVATLPAGAYTAILRGKTNGVGLVEVYDISATETGRLANISTRSKVQQDDNGALIAGFIVAAPNNAPGTARKVIIRALGPALKTAGLSDALVDPTLEIYRGSQKIMENDNWKTQTSQGAGSKSEIEASGLKPNNDKEAAILTTLDPGSYTAVVRGKNNTTGIALVEVYRLD